MSDTDPYDDPEFDNIISALSDAEWSRIQSQPTVSRDPPSSIRPPPSTASTIVVEDDHLDAGDIAALDQAESRHARTPTTSQHRQEREPVAGPSNSKASHSTEPSPKEDAKVSPTRKRRKLDADSESSPSSFLDNMAGFEDELTCPICFDIVVAAHSGNPCGHTYCGECAYAWILKNRTSCPTCRANLSFPSCLIPCVMIDGVANWYVQRLRGSHENEELVRSWDQRLITWRSHGADWARQAKNITPDYGGQPHMHQRLEQVRLLRAQIASRPVRPMYYVIEDGD